MVQINIILKVKRSLGIAHASVNYSEKRFPQNADRQTLCYLHFEIFMKLLEKSLLLCAVYKYLLCVCIIINNRLFK